FNLLSEKSAKEISKTCVRLFLPALLIVNVGSQLHLDTAMKYVPVLVWAITYNVLSMLLGLVVTRIFKLPAWVTPAIAFNNTTSLPLLLVQSLDATGILGTLLMSSSDSSSDAVARAKSYFLVNAMVGNSLTFALGPKLLNGQEEDAPDQSPEETKGDANGANGGRNTGASDDVERGREGDGDDGPADEEQHERATEETSLLPDPVVRQGVRSGNEGYKRGKHYWDKLPPWAQKALDFLYQFLNAPLIGAVIGATIGLVPALHTLFFSDQASGGYLNAWLTSSIRNVGELFAALQVIVVGVKLSQAMLALKTGGESGRVPWKAMLFVTAVRFLAWPLLSISVVYALAKKTTWLDRDPILWFAMMLMPTGPPAMKLTALADVNGAEEKEKMSIAKFLTISYVVSPLICFAVVGSLKASEAAMGK
ncbi:hypothetical protein LTR04_006855, partial [Oleoguttula sp. CCFEE 6159]